MKYPAKSLVLLFAAALLPSSVSAQLVGDDSPELRRPYRGLFGSSTDPRAPQSLVFNASLYGAYDDDLTGRGEGSRPHPSETISGYYAGFQSNAEYSRKTDGYTLGMDGGVQVHRYFDQSYTAPAYFQGITYDTRLWGRARLALTERFLHTPNYRVNLLPATGPVGDDNPDAGSGDPDLDLFRLKANRYLGVAAFSQPLGRRSELTAFYDIRYVDFNAGDREDFRTNGFAFGFSHRITSHAALRLGYGRRTSSNLQAGSDIHRIDAGVDYSRAISLSRRTSLAFSTGSAVQMADSTQLARPTRTQFHFIGSARLQHEIGRTWTAAASYRRALNVREGFDQPLMTDAVAATLGGLISRRLEMTINAGFVDASGTIDTRTAYQAFSASTNLQYALNRGVAIFARYFYYDYEFSDQAALESGLAVAAQRNGVRVGITTTLPLIR